MAFGFGLGFPRAAVNSGGAFAGAALALDMTSGNQTLDPRVTFTRASNATRVNSSGLIELVAVNEPRFDYDPVTLQPKGLLIEEQRTNSIRNNTMQGAVVGTPGTDPANWSVAGTANGITKEIVGTGTEDGISYVDVKYSGTPSAGTNVAISFEPPNQVIATSGQTWTESVFLKLQAGSFNATTTTLSLLGTDGTGGTENFQSSSITSTPTSLKEGRLVVTGTFALITTTRVQPRIRIGYTVGTPIDLTLRIGLPQLEQGAFATSVIPTTTAAATRAADVAVMTGSNFSSWYRQDEGTLFADAGVLSVGYTGGVLLDIGAGGAFGTTAYLNWNGSAWGVNPTTAPVSMLSGVTTTAPAKIAAALSANNTVVAANGILGAVDTSCAMPASPTTLSIGVRGWSSGNGNFFNGHIRRIAYFPRRLANSELQAITS